MVRGKFIAPINFEFNLHRVTRGGERRIRGKLYEDFCPPRFVALIVDQILLPRCVASMLMDPYLLFLLQRKSGIRMARVDSPTTSVSQFSLSFPLPSPSFRTEQQENFCSERNSVEDSSYTFVLRSSFQYLFVINLLNLEYSCVGVAENVILVLFLSTKIIVRNNKQVKDEKVNILIPMTRTILRYRSEKNV